MLSHCNKNGLVFNPDKFRFARREVEFAGFLITEDGMKPAAKYMAAIRDFPTPRIKYKIMCWKFNMIYILGKMQNVAYAISRCNHFT